MPTADPQPAFDEAGTNLNVDPMLLRAIAQVESGGEKNPDTAVSSAGALGRMQVMPANLKHYNVSDPSDPRQNIHAGAALLDEALTASNGNVPMALRIYQGGPDQSKWGPNNAAYPGKVAAAYQALAKAPQAAAPSPGAPAAPDATDAFLSGTTGGGGAKAAAPAPDATDTFLAGKEDTGGSSDIPTMTVKPEGGIIRNAAAGVLGAAGNTADVVANPAGNLIGKPLATAAVFAHDALAPYLGYARFPDDVRNLLLGDTVAQPGSQAIAGIGNALGANPAAVPATTTAEQLTRAGVVGAASVAMLGGGGGGAVMGGAGALAGQQAATLAPDWAKPAAALAGNIVGGAAAVPAMAGVNLLKGGINRFANVPEAEAVAAPSGGPAPAQGPQSGPSPGMGGPQPAGAMASTPAEAELTPAQVQAYRSTAEGSKLLEPQQPGIADATPYVRGVNPNQAEIEQTVNTARELKALNITAPGVSQEAKEIAAAHSEARGQAFDAQSKGPVDVMNAKAAREAQLEADYPAAFSGAKDADTQPVVDAVQGVMTDPRGRQNTQLQTYVKPLLSRLVDEDGNLKITNPEELYGFREDLARMTSKASQAETPNLTHVAGELNDLIGVTDKAIEAAAPGYRNYMDNYAAASRGIDQMQVLQEHKNGLFNAQNQMTYNKFQTMMRNVVDSRMAPGLNQYKSITDDTMSKLWDIRDDLRRSASAQELARAPGSDTIQNNWDVTKGLAKAGGEMLAHGVANKLAPGIGSIAVMGGKQWLGRLSAAKAERQQTARGMNLLHPDPAKFPPSNRLSP